MKSIAEITDILKNTPDENMCDFIAQFNEDERQGVVRLVNKAQKVIQKAEKEAARLETMLKYEHKYGEYQYICGIDEVGRGPFAGPVVAAAVILPKECKIIGLDDSKKLSAATRKKLYTEITQKAIAYGVGIVSAEVIDEINILQATYKAMHIAVNKLAVKPDILLNDAVIIPNIDIKQISIIHGDAQSLSIAAASVVAKVLRDEIMEQYAEIYPEYGFDKNMGYGTEEHRLALKKVGASPIHRQTFIKNWL